MNDVHNQNAAITRCNLNEEIAIIILYKSELSRYIEMITYSWFAGL